MAATVEIDEANGVGEDITHDIANSNMGSADEAELDPVDNPITAGNRSFVKYQSIHVTDMGGSSKIDNLKVWRTGALAGAATHVTNARESSYGGAITYATPTESAVSGVNQTMPTTEPTGPNLGIGGSLSGEITSAPASSDYVAHQIVTDAGDVAGASATMNYQYDETA